MMFILIHTGKTNGKHIISQINCCYDQCYKVVKDVEVLNRKAGLDREGQGKFSQDDDLLLR